MKTKKYLLYTSIFAIFTEIFFVHFIIDWKLFYLIIISNYFLLFKITKIKINKYFAYVLGGLFIHGIIVNSIIGVPPNYMISQLLGMSVIGIYYYNFIPLYDKEEIIKVYLKICFYVAVLGYILYFLKIDFNGGGRLQSIFKEPAHYVVVIIPSCYYYLKRKMYPEFLVIFGTLILSQSSLGYIGCGLMILVPNLNLKRVLYLLALVPFVLGTFYYVYNEYPFFKLRVDDTTKSLHCINSGKFDEKINLSSYAILSNLFVANKNVTDHPFGSGIGSHLYMYENVYRGRIRPPQFLITQNLDDTNATDANSMFTRMISELGIFGFLFIISIIIVTSKVFSSNKLYFAQGLFIYILLKLFRDGHYFSPELYFFVWMLYFYVRDEKETFINKKAST